MILKEDVKNWLKEPVTDLLLQWIKKDRQDHYDVAAAKCFSTSAHNQKNEFAAGIFGLCKGMDRVISLIEDCKEQMELERENDEEKDKTKHEVIDDVIVEMIKYVEGSHE